MDQNLATTTDIGFGTPSWKMPVNSAEERLTLITLSILADSYGQVMTNTNQLARRIVTSQTSIETTLKSLTSQGYITATRYNTNQLLITIKQPGRKLPTRARNQPMTRSQNVANKVLVVTEQLTGKPDISMSALASDEGLLAALNYYQKTTDAEISTALAQIAANKAKYGLSWLARQLATGINEPIQNAQAEITATIWSIFTQKTETLTKQPKPWNYLVVMVKNEVIARIKQNNKQIGKAIYSPNLDTQPANQQTPIQHPKNTDTSITEIQTQTFTQLTKLLTKLGVPTDIAITAIARIIEIATDNHHDLHYLARKDQKLATLGFSKNAAAALASCLYGSRRLGPKSSIIPQIHTQPLQLTRHQQTWLNQIQKDFPNPDCHQPMLI